MKNFQVEVACPYRRGIKTLFLSGSLPAIHFSFCHPNTLCRGAGKFQKKYYFIYSIFKAVKYKLEKVNLKYIFEKRC